MTNNELLKKMSQDMEMRNFSSYTYDFYLRKTKEMIRYFDKPMEEVTIEELRNFLYIHLLQEKKVADKTVNHYNSVIRFVEEVTLDKLINKKQLPMRKIKKKVFKVLTKEELSTFFNCVDNYKFKTIFMLVYGSGLRIGEVTNLHISDIDSKNRRIFVREGKGNKERYAVLPKKSLEMLRKYWRNYRPKVDTDFLFLNECNKPINQYVIRTHFRKYRRKAKLDEKVTVHTLRHSFCTSLIENGATLIQAKELMGHSNIRSTMHYVHIAKIDLDVKSPLDVFLEGEENGKDSRNIK